MQTMQQKRAAFALKHVEQAKNAGVNQKEYKSYAAALPAMIHMNGLGQAVAFYLSKVERDNRGNIIANDLHYLLYKLLSDWLCQEGQPYAGYKDKKDKDLLSGITQEDMHKYLLAQAEAMALMDWVKKFAEAYMSD
jgi:CRISPR-associated protein Cmr5